MIIFGRSPDASVVAAFEASVREVRHWVDIYYADNVSMWRAAVPFVSGTVSVDMDRSERRNLDITFVDKDNDLRYGPGWFWYDKIIKPYRGIVLSNGDYWVAPLGAFMIDRINRARFPNTLEVTARDFAKKLMTAKFAETTTFAANGNVGDVVRAIAIAGGVEDFNFVTVAKTIAEDLTFERNTERWDAIQKVAEAANHEVFFDRFHHMTLRPFVDPLTAPPSFTFKHGSSTANLIDFSRSTDDSRIFNDVVVYGDGPTNPLVFAQAENNHPSSPTRIAQLGRRTYPRSSALIDSNDAAQDLADSILSVSALESYDMNLTSMVMPWLDAGDAVDIFTLDSSPGDPTRFLFTNFSIPLELGDMTGTAKRITIVGDG